MNSHFLESPFIPSSKATPSNEQQISTLHNYVAPKQTPLRDKHKMIQTIISDMLQQRRHNKEVTLSPRRSRSFIEIAPEPSLSTDTLCSPNPIKNSSQDHSQTSLFLRKSPISQTIHPHSPQPLTNDQYSPQFRPVNGSSVLTKLDVTVQDTLFLSILTKLDVAVRNTITQNIIQDFCKQPRRNGK